MGHPAGKGPDGLHFLGLAQPVHHFLFFQLRRHTLGDVPADSAKSAGQVIIVFYQGNGCFNITLGPVFPAELPVQGLCRYPGPKHLIKGFKKE